MACSARAHMVTGCDSVVFAINAMPLATANAIFYAAPLMMLPLALVFFKEQLQSLLYCCWNIRLYGRSGHHSPEQIDWAAIAALIVALTIASNNLLIRKLPKHQTVAQTLLLTNLAGVPASLGLAIWEGREWDWSPLITAAGSSGFILIYAAYMCSHLPIGRKQ